jgi:hypothetical protein
MRGRWQRYAAYCFFIVQKVIAMHSLRRRQHSASDPLEAQFKSTMQGLGSCVVSLIQLLNLPANQVSASALGTGLANLLKQIRAHHSAVLALGARTQDVKAQVKYLQALLDLRATVAQWLTVHAAQPQLIFVEVNDFESQCWSTLGMGMVLFESISVQGSRIEEAMPSHFLKWWQQLNTRPAFLSRQTTGFASGFH